jgi:hypothetical protein
MLQFSFSRMSLKVISQYSSGWPLILGCPAQRARSTSFLENLVSDAVWNRFRIEHPVIPHGKPFLLNKLLQSFLAEHLNVGLVLEDELFDGKGYKIAVSWHDTMPLEDGDRHVFDPVFIVEDLALVLHKEVQGYLPQRSRPSGFDQGLDQKRLVDMAHSLIRFSRKSESSSKVMSRFLLQMEIRMQKWEQRGDGSLVSFLTHF